MQMKKTQLVQKNISDPMEANYVFNEEQGTQVSLVLVPATRYMCSFFYNIPSGVYAIVHNCGDDANPEVCKNTIFIDFVFCFQEISPFLKHNDLFLCLF